MRKIVCFLSIVSLLSNVAFGDCTFSDLTHNANGTVVYSAADHVCVGQLVQDNKTKDQQIQDLNKAISLKDLAISTADQRTENWMATSLKLEASVQKADTLKKDEFWIAFGIGVATTFAAGMAAASLTNRR